MKLIDTHTHLSCPDFDKDREEAFQRAVKVCDYLIDIGSGTEVNAFQKARNLADAKSEVYFTAGIHPHDADKVGNDETCLNEIQKLLSHPKCVAVGECGLDYFYDNSKRENQKETFKWHINLAQKTNMPLVIHTRDAEDDTKELLGSYNGPAVLHCFTGTKDLAAFGVKKGYFISFSGIVTFNKASELRKVAEATPLENMLVETDAPYLAPVPMRGKRNESSFIEHTAKFLAELKGISVEEFSNKSSENALKLFSKIKT